MEKLEQFIKDLQDLNFEFINRKEVLNRITEIHQALQLHKTQVSGSCNIYVLECLNEDGNLEINGHFFDKTKAQTYKCILDDMPMNKKYGIIQDIVEVQVI